jgi:hypothetical protein
VIFGIYAPKNRQKPLRQKPAKNLSELCEDSQKPLRQKPNKMNIEQIKEDIIKLIAEATDADFYDIDNIRDSVEYIFSSNTD